jgi:hypothetical protein
VRVGDDLRVAAGHVEHDRVRRAGNGAAHFDVYTVRVRTCEQRKRQTYARRNG